MQMKSNSPLITPKRASLNLRGKASKFTLHTSPLKLSPKPAPRP